MQIHYVLPAELESPDSQILRVDGVMVVMPYLNLDLAKRSATLMASRAGTVSGKILCIEDRDQRGFIYWINQSFRKTQSAYFAYVAEDSFAGRDWLGLGLRALGDSRHLLGFNDGKWAGALAGFGLARRSWAQQNYASWGLCI
jgi:hypothetical protein